MPKRLGGLEPQPSCDYEVMTMTMSLLYYITNFYIHIIYIIIVITIIVVSIMTVSTSILAIITYIVIVIVIAIIIVVVIIMIIFITIIGRRSARDRLQEGGQGGAPAPGLHVRRVVLGRRALRRATGLSAAAGGA